MKGLSVRLLGPDPRPCLVGHEKRPALLHGFSTKAWTHEESALIGGFPAGQISYPVAVVEFECGNVDEVRACDVVMIDSEYKFSEFSFSLGDDNERA